MEQWKELLAFNRTERRGIWLLLILISCIIGIDVIISHSPPKTDSDQLRVMLVEGEKRRFQEKGPWQKWSSVRKYEQQKKDSLFQFDPNKLTLKEWQLLGLSQKQAQSLVNYVAHGGKFRTKEDLKRSFVITDKFFQKVEPFINIQQVEPIKRDKRPIKPPFLLVDINTADTADWRKLSGIGTILASRIVKYRESLGGFHSIEQLLEVYGIREETIERNRAKLVTGTGAVKKIRINTENAKSLSTHPYIDRKLAYLLTELRKDSPFRSEEDLKNRLPATINIHPHLWLYLVY